MSELSDTTEQVAVSTSALIRGVIDGLNLVVSYITQETTAIIKMVSNTVSIGIVNLINTTIGFYADEWPIIESYLNGIDAQVNGYSVSAVNNINTLLDRFESVTNTLLNNFESQLTQIDAVVSANYDARMFTIYGEIAAFSKAINAPPDYLEGVIQNARFFAMAIACVEGLSYYQFLSEWDTGVSRLLFLIAGSVALYRANPQRIKTDIENSLIKPIFDIAIAGRRAEQATLNNLNSRVDNIQTNISTLSTKIDDNTQALVNLFNNVIEPKLAEIQNNFESWKTDIYDFNLQAANTETLRLWNNVNDIVANIQAVGAMLDYGGDLLLRIDKLPIARRIEQEEEILDVATRRFRALIPDWQDIVTTKRG